MNALLVKLFATALTFSQVTTRPDAIRTAFDPAKDGAEVTQLLRDGCAHLRKAFDIEDINVDELLAVAMEDPKAVAGDTKILKDLDFKDLELAYRQFCKGASVERSVADLSEVIRTYNEAVADLPDVNKLKGFRLPGASLVLDESGRRFAEVYGADSRRVWVPLASVPEIVRKAFVAAEDKRFYSHRGLDERGVIRAFMTNLSGSGRPQGGSTITQQVVKNLLVGDDVTYQRKMREMILASRLERILSKDEILEIYLNAIYLGRTSWGIEMAAQSYFGKSASALDLREAALLATLPKGPHYYDPDRFPDRSRERTAYVLSRLVEDGAIDEPTRAKALADKPITIAAERSRRDSGLYFLDHVNREARTLAGIEGLSAASYVVRSTVDPALQRAAESALQEGLVRYELSTGRQRFGEPEGNLAAAIEKLRAAPAPVVPVAPAVPEAAPSPGIQEIDGPGSGAPKPSARKPTRAKPAASAATTGAIGKADGPAAKPDWLRALEVFRAPLYDVRWPVGVVLNTQPGAFRVGLRDGRVVSLSVPGGEARRALKLYDVVLVRAGQKGQARADLRMRPSVQGAAVVLENKTGRILAMVGGFSYPLSQLNRTTQALRQPGSTLKPVTYLAALAAGVQPNTLLWDQPVTLPPIGGHGDAWTPRNADRSGGGLTTLRRALEGSKNQVTARLLDGVIASRAETSLQKVCELTLEVQVYADCERYYPFVLGAQPARVLDLAVLYATIANEGARPSPYALESVEEAGRTLYRHEAKPPARIASADAGAFYQLKSMLQGVVARGTARSMAKLSPYIGGKTGTSENENDAWFAGFSNEVTVVVWVGNDNADGQRRTLGRGQSGGKVAVPIFEQIMTAAWATHGPRTALAPPSNEARRVLAAVPIEFGSGDVVEGGRGFTEYLRRGTDTQHRFVGREETFAGAGPRDDNGDGDDSFEWDDGTGGWRGGGGATTATPRWGAPSGVDGMLAWPQDEPRRRPRRIDPDYPWDGGEID